MENCFPYNALVENIEFCPFLFRLLTLEDGRYYDSANDWAANFPDPFL